MFAVCIILALLSTSAVVCRFYARRIKGMRLQADDWTVLVALVCDYIEANMSTLTNAIRSSPGFALSVCSLVWQIKIVF